MTSTNQAPEPGQPSDPAMFAPLTTDENRILSTHLTSGWYKQSAVYPVLSEPWQETGALLGDLGKAFDAAFEARAKAEPHLTDSTPAAGTGAPEADGPEAEAGS